MKDGGTITGVTEFPLQSENRNIYRGEKGQEKLPAFGNYEITGRISVSVKG